MDFNGYGPPPGMGLHQPQHMHHPQQLHLSPPHPPPLHSHPLHHQQPVAMFDRRARPEEDLNLMTVRLTSVSGSTLDDAIQRHMEAHVGPVAAMATERDDGSSRKGKFDERSVMVQFYEAAACARALRSPFAVCDNRFIMVRRGSVNVVDPATLTPPESLAPTGLGAGRVKPAGQPPKSAQAKKLRGLPGAASLPARSGQEQLMERLAKARELAAKQEDLKAQRHATLEKQLGEAKAMLGKAAKVKGGAALVATLEAKIAQLEAQLAVSTDKLDPKGVLPQGLDPTALPATKATPASSDGRPSVFVVEALPQGIDVATVNKATLPGL
jgi:hypothetical protein